MIASFEAVLLWAGDIEITKNKNGQKIKEKKTIARFADEKGKSFEVFVVDNDIAKAIKSEKQFSKLKCGIEIIQNGFRNYVNLIGYSK